MWLRGKRKECKQPFESVPIRMHISLQNIFAHMHSVNGGTTHRPTRPQPNMLCAATATTTTPTTQTPPPLRTDPHPKPPCSPLVVCCHPSHHHHHPISPPHMHRYTHTRHAACPIMHQHTDACHPAAASARQSPCHSAQLAGCVCERIAGSSNDAGVAAQGDCCELCRWRCLQGQLTHSG
jgi:hypothetical protein